MVVPGNSSVLVIFCKRPAIGIGKQRVAATLGTTKALAVNELLLATTLEDAAAWRGRVVISPASAADTDWASALLKGAEVVPQAGGNLGERINHVDRRLRAAGAERIIYIGSDAPGLDAVTLEKAAEALRNNDVVIIPARDGGVTLLGSGCAWPDLANLPWETARLGAALQACCADAHMSCEEFPPGYDIDSWDDLRAALPLLGADERPARRRLAEWIRHEQSISLIVPVYRDLEQLNALLVKLDPMRGYIDELLIVDGDVDGDQSAECRQVCEHFGATYLTASACRGAQLAAGAAQASGNILWFLHSDCQPAADAPELIRRQIGSGGVGGYFRFGFLGQPAWAKQLLAKAINLRAKLGVPYGDQGLFATRAAYEKAGGFPALPLFEEVSLVRGLRAAGEFGAVTGTIGVSPRRWERDGWLHRSLANRMLWLGFILGIAPSTLARHYRAGAAVGAQPTGSN